MNYIRRCIQKRKPRDILSLSLRNLRVGEEIICTKNTYNSIKDRIGQFYQSRNDMRMSVIPRGSIRKIRRVA